MQNKLNKGSQLFLNRLLALLVLLALVFTPFNLNGNSYSSTAKAATTVDVGPTDNMDDGAILHAWCWSFNSIKNNMDKISNAGYTSIQTSPINNVVAGNGGDLKFTNQWWYHYQPTDYKIGNYQLGTEAEFAAMCAEAEKYGIKIIVDVVANHCTSNYNLISSDIKNQANFFHTNESITNWNDRYQVTQKALLQLWDNNTQNSTVQNYIKNYLLKCISLGADGFRYDAAKHIELPDDGSYGGSFWPTVLNNGAEFQYGEILQDGISRDAAYANYMSVTASNYGKKIRDNIGNNSLNASAIGSYEIGVSSDKIVTWVESHDNYANAITDYGSSQWMTDEQLKLAWAVVCARNGGTPLFFSRPVGGGGTSWDNRFPEITKMGDAGSALFYDDEVSAVNKFRNAMVGQNEYLRNPNGDNKVLMIERGTKGVVIVNLNSYSTNLSSVTNLAAGTYTNQTDDNSTYTVSNGTITGTLPARSVVVLYQDGTTPVDPPVDGNTVTLYYKTSWTNANIHYQIGTGSWTTAPGVAMSNADVSGYKTITLNLGTATKLTACFNNGSGTWDNNNSSNYTLSPGTYTIANGVVTTGKNTTTTNSITVYYYTGWTNPYIHYQVGSGNWTTAPGVAMSSSSYSGYKMTTLNLGTATNLTACFNNGSGSWDSNNGYNYYFGSTGTYTVKNGVITSGTP